MLMVVNGLKLPETFVKLCEDIREGKTERHWLLKGRVDTYGNYLSNSDIEFLADPESIKEQTDHIRGLIGHDEYFEADPSDCTQPGFVEDPSGDQLIWFGTVGSGEPFCFDFGQAPEEPSIITWNDAYWQRVAPNFETFLSLFAPGTDEQWEAWAHRPH
jgi:hypothetical protein